MKELETKLGYEFKDCSLLKTALVHSSYANENRHLHLECNERLEFLGDSVLGLAVARHLFLSCPGMPEGRMTRLRAELVCEQSLYSVAQKLGLGRFIMLGRGEELTGGRERQSILADCVEAVIAAMYLDGGIEVASGFIGRMILAGFDPGAHAASADHKTELQELVQRRSGQVLAYEMVGESGPDHCKTFTARVLLNGEPIGEGSGRSKKDAEQAAACRALEELKK
ncbi:MAG TPA: ribonuclease III [Firmicutes bacterium]|nr:ribonuclease III [Bacillota bacterium]